jgi:CheY-like chemotaxis protein
LATILIVEDEPMILAIAQAEFEDAGHRVLEATDSDSALEVMLNNPEIDLMFTDVRMPGGLDGWALARAARMLSPALPIIYATGFSDEAPRPVEGGVMFTKPYRLSDIVETAQTMLGQSG